MKRLFGRYAYSEGPRATCWWDETADIPQSAALTGDITCDVAIIGGGFTGLSAALHLAEAGTDVIVIDADRIGWGASGRNGGFCCLGGGRLDDAALDARFGREGRLEWRQTEVAAVTLAAELIDRLNLDVDRHSNGETLLAHQPKRVAEMEAHARHIEDSYGVQPAWHDAKDLADQGMNGPFHAAVTNPIGFALNPRKYVAGLRAAALARGARIFEGTPATRIEPGTVHTPAGTIRAKAVILATNGYSSEDLPGWLAGRYIPTQSTVVVTRPLTGEELQAAGWTTQQASYDTRNLLHYFRLMPDNRMLFGMRGGILSSPRSDRVAKDRVNADFNRMFPAWAHVERPHAWSGFVCLARNNMPFVGEVPGHAFLFAGMCYHGNGVAMGTFSGKILADLVSGQKPSLYPKAIQTPLEKFPLGRARRALVPLAYAGYALADR